MERFSLYLDLNTQIQQFRLITLQISQDNEEQPIRCSLTTHSLSHDPPAFVALSYVWGDDPKEDTVIINGCPFQVTSNLCQLLYSVRRLQAQSPRERSFWVDAICINQADKNERSAQVLLMGQIYRQAEFVIAWLGQFSADMQLAFQVLDICHNARLNGKRPNSKSWLRKHKELLCRVEISSDGLAEKSMDPPYNTAWRSLFKLTTRGYWRRLWTFQEAVLPCAVYLLCGSKISSLDNLLWVFVWLMNCDLNSCPDFMDDDIWELIADNSYIRSSTGFGRIAAIYNVRRSVHSYCDHNIFLRVNIIDERTHLQDNTESSAHVAHDELSIFQIASVTKALRASDPRDKVYGILGLARSSIIPDYKKSVCAVLKDFARTALPENLDILMKYSRWIDGNKPRIREAPDLPSWVPSLSLYEGRFIIPGSSTYSAGDHPDTVGSTLPKEWPNPWAEGDILHVHGILCDKITNVSDIIQESNIFDMVSKYLCDEPTGILYITGIPRFQAILRVLLQDKDLEDGGHIVPGDGSLQRHVWAFLSWLLFPKVESGIEVCQLLDEIGLEGLVESEDREAVFNARILGHVNDGPFIAEGYTIHEALNPAQRLWHPILHKMDLNEQHRLFHTESGYLGIGPKSVDRGDTVCVLFGCNSPMILRPVRSHYLNLGPSFVLGFQEGEAIRDMQAGVRRHQEFIIQ